MTTQDKKELLNALVRLIDDNDTLTPMERRDILEETCKRLGGWSAQKYLQETQNNRKLKIKRGTAAENDNYTGACGEITMDTDSKTLRLHDGETVGGIALARCTDVGAVMRANYTTKTSITTTIDDRFICPSDGFITIKVCGNNTATKLGYASSLMSVAQDDVAYGIVCPAGNNVCVTQYYVQSGEVLTCIKSEGENRICCFTPIQGI